VKAHILHDSRGLSRFPLLGEKIEKMEKMERVLPPNDPQKSRESDKPDSVVEQPFI